jgi:hypothetical protein
VLADTVEQRIVGEPRQQKRNGEQRVLVRFAAPRRAQRIQALRNVGARAVAHVVAQEADAQGHARQRAQHDDQPLHLRLAAFAR